MKLLSESFDLRPFVKQQKKNKKRSNINGGLRAARVAAYVMKSRVTVRDLIGRRSRGSRSGQSKNERGLDLIELNAPPGATARAGREGERALIDKV